MRFRYIMSYQHRNSIYFYPIIFYQKFQAGLFFYCIVNCVHLNLMSIYVPNSSPIRISFCTYTAYRRIPMIHGGLPSRGSKFAATSIPPLRVRATGEHHLSRLHQQPSLTSLYTSHRQYYSHVLIHNP